MRPERPYTAFVAGRAVYVGFDLNEAMRVFEAAADQAATEAGADMIVFAMPPAGMGHTVPGNEGRPVVEAHAMGNPGSKSFVGALYGVSVEQWRDRPREPGTRH